MQVSEPVTNAASRIIGIIDDDDAVRDSLKFLLEVAGHVVEAFASASEFLAAETRHLVCLILDHHMPHMTGLQLLERLRAEGWNVPVLLITGSPSPAIVSRAAELGVERVLEKPPVEDDVLDFVTAALS